MDCLRCGATAPEGKRFCGDCGAPLPWRCAACGGANPIGSRFCGECGVAAGSSPAPAELPPPAPSGPERRQLTVMFCDLVGSTPLGARLDPEDLREVIAAYHRTVTAEVIRAGGFVARYMGDGLLVYFGYPKAHETDAEHAVRAGLAVVEAVARLATMAGPPGTLATRVGIATGLVVVGDLIGAGASREEAVVGDTPNLANRLQTRAEPNTVLIADSTQRLTAGLFEYRALGAISVRGYDLPIQAWQVLREAAIDSRFEALRAGNRIPLLGRDEELSLLMRRWEQARGGEGRVVLLSGEAGIGKSRLSAALDERLLGEPHLRLRWFCAPHYQDTALHPVISNFVRHAGFEREDDGATKLAKLEALLAHTAPPAEDVALIADLLSLPVSPEARLAELTPQRRKERSFAAILRQYEALARTQPLLGVFEDLHWADPTTLELLDQLVASIEHMPTLLVATSRPDLQPSWSGHPHVSVVMLNRLARNQAASLVDGVAAGRPLSDSVREQIIAHADGVPLFVEELTKTVLDSGLIAMDLRAAAELRPPVVVPSSLHASLMSRLDRLASVKDVAQMGAVMGREFSFETFLAAFHLPRELAAGSLRVLVDGDVMVARGRPPNAVYSFKHALMQDAAYGSLLRDRRRALHFQVASTLERDQAGASAEPELLAYHFAEAGVPDRAIDYHLKAAEQAMARCAIAEMVSHLRRGLGLLAALPAGPATRRRELALQTALGRGLIDKVGSASDEGHAAFVRARELCLELNETEILLPILYGLQVYHFTHAEPEVVTRYAREILDLGARTGNRHATMLGERVGGSAYLLLGRFAESRSAYENLLRLYDPVEEASVASEEARDPMVAGCAFLGICVTVMGYLEQGRAVTTRGLTYGETLGHAISVVFILRRGCITAMLRRDVETVRTLSARLLEVSTDYETFLGGPEGHFFQSWALLHDCTNDALEDAELDKQLRHSLDQLDSTKTWALLSYFMAAAAELKGERGDRDGARTLLARAAELARLTGERWCQPEITRLQARFNAVDASESAAMLREALAVARVQEAKLWELRAATDLARLLSARGERDAARDLLGPVYAWFTEGLDTPDVVAARAVLEEV
ncbi:MAG TPA: AAA family ATPase [Acetobacteraceae bacterium]|nr:AAA family ATPase [Acetobacteraceae bacterium]